jgi:hypothetical protein
MDNLTITEKTENEFHSDTDEDKDEEETQNVKEVKQDMRLVRQS